MFDWITSLVEQSGYFGIALLMFIENIFPPIPSELIMPLAGFMAYQGQFNPLGVVLMGSVGSLVGTSLWYWAACRLDRHGVFDLIARYGRWLTVSRAGLEKAEDTFSRHDTLAVFLGRMIPGVRTLISVPAGFARMPPMRFALYSLAGTVIWVSLLTGLGYVLGNQYDKVAQWLNPVSNVLIAMLVAIYVIRVIRGKGGA